jgi:hypothetical protein
VGLAICLASPAAGHRFYPFGGQYRHTPGQYLYLPYAMTSGHPSGYTTAINRAMRAWFDTPTRVWPYPSNFQQSVVDFYMVSNQETWWGMALNRPCSGTGCAYRWTDVYLNRRTMDPETLFTSQGIVVHEVGHALGLSHVCGQTSCPAGSDRTIMQWGRLSYNTPQNHDINDINAIYR